MSLLLSLKGMVLTVWKILDLSLVVMLSKSVSKKCWLIGFVYGYLHLSVATSLLSSQGEVLLIIFFFVRSLLEDTIKTLENLGVL